MVATARVDPLDVACHTKNMASSPHLSPPGKQFELRVAASDLEFDKKLSALTLPATRSLLPGFLHLYGERNFSLTVQDRDIDGRSNAEAQFRGFQMRITNRNRNKFSLSPEIEKIRLSTGEKEIRIKVALELGLQVASEIMTAPFFTREERNDGIIPLYYTVPDPVHTRTMGVAFEDLEAYLSSKPRGIVDELILIESAFRTRAIRRRVRPDNPVTDPIDLEVSEEELKETDTLQDVS